MTHHTADGYKAFRALREGPSYTTDDGITIEEYGSPNNYVSQGYTLTHGDTTSKHHGFHGSETIFRALMAFRGKTLPPEVHS